MKDFQLLIYSTPAEDVKVDVVLKDENIWATQKAMSLLFGIGVPGINKHIKHIFETGELNPEVVISKMETTTIHGAMAKCRGFAYPCQVHSPGQVRLVSQNPGHESQNRPFLHLVSQKSGQ